MDDSKQKPSTNREALEKEEAERLAKLAEAKKEIEGMIEKKKTSDEEIDEQESDGSANAFENK